MRRAINSVSRAISCSIDQSSIDPALCCKQYEAASAGSSMPRVRGGAKITAYGDEAAMPSTLQYRVAHVPGCKVSRAQPWST